MVSRKSEIKTIPIAKPYFDEREERLILKVVRSGWIAQGKMVEEFEKKVARFVGSRYAIATTSGTTALHLALIAAGIRPGDEVIVPSFSFIATANSILFCAAKPIFVDIDLKTYNINPEKIEDAIKKRPRVKAIIPVHQFGLPCDMDAISRIARKHNLSIIEDAACALGSCYKARRIGGMGNVACLSFHPRKILTTGEGGMVLTDNISCAKMARKLRNHGLRISGREDYEILGYNWRLTDIQAAMGIVQISRISEVLKERIDLASRYNNAFKNFNAISVPFIPSYAKPNYQSYVIRLDGVSHVSVGRILGKLLKKGIHARRGNTAIHLQSFYKREKQALPNTEKAAATTIALPIYFKMTKKEQDLVIEAVISILTGEI